MLMCLWFAATGAFAAVAQLLPCGRLQSAVYTASPLAVSASLVFSAAFPACDYRSKDSCPVQYDIVPIARGWHVNCNGVSGAPYSEMSEPS